MIILFSDSNDDLFIKSIDELILSSLDNSKFNNAIKFIEKESQLRGKTLYQTIFEIIQKEIIEERVDNGLKINEKANI